MAKDYKQIISDIRKRIFHPVYLLSGEEPYYIDLISDVIEKEVLDEAGREFNQSVLYGRDVDARTIVDYAKRYPMMASHQVVIVKEAQDVKTLDDIAKYVEKPLESTILVLCYKYKKYDKRKSLAKIVEKNGVYFESAKIYEDKIPAWINAQTEASGYSISQKACIMISEFLGNDLSKIDNELSKLYISLPKGSQINEKLVETNIGISKDFNVFELQIALAKRDVLKSNRIVAHFASNPKENPLTKVVVLLYAFFSKVILVHAMSGKPDNEIASAAGVSVYFLSDYRTAARNYNLDKLAMIIGLMREYDLKAKGVDSGSADGGELTKELIYKILH
ncbi:MAG: DNA polymerase III subunit delta [Bacteroidetes bacterium HGW-Bacteroidetes-11]|jgi:DNA polymerase-3 subunit delta|nr:MAG: DNA polymerase III subunit delta [Bacteroidetes bacterium HGW-Bacteroidetes-11]